ncbi:unnamed protein product [Lactuca virosa]|uniref:Protein kinase domain-containing protein n=1 Tax=Lactuca virosa TaxID=75947 RepID=A0AAU9LPK5_9ASTR|nr:unnamed protein product [Lactuca virosa]
MSSSRINLEEYLIPLEEIVLATHNFSSETEIGRGGASVIFGGQLSERWQNRKAAFKRLYPHDLFGQPKFLNSVELIWNLNDRPTMNMVVKRIQEALDIQNHEAASTITVSSQQHQSLESFVIPLEEIVLATQNFRDTVGGGTGNVYKGQLSKRWGNRTAAIKRFHQDNDQNKDYFRNDLKLVSSFHHENVIGFIGYCDEANEMITIYDYAINGSVHHHLYKPEINKSNCLTWTERLHICIGAARGLEYLHSGLWQDTRVIHRNIQLTNILLDENLQAKISNFTVSLLVDRNQPQAYDDLRARNGYYQDPIYDESGLVNTQSDIYSFGVVMLEMLSGTEAYKRRTIGDGQPQTLIHLVRHHYHEGLDILIDPVIRDQINMHSFRAFIKIVYRCVSLKLEDRPTMKKIIKQIEEARDIQNYEASCALTTQRGQHQNLEIFRIPLKDINLAIKDFSQETPIGGGGYGSTTETSSLSSVTVMKGNALPWIESSTGSRMQWIFKKMKCRKIKTRRLVVVVAGSGRRISS